MALVCVSSSDPAEPTHFQLARPSPPAPMPQRTGPAKACATPPLSGAGRAIGRQPALCKKTQLWRGGVLYIPRAGLSPSCCLSFLGFSPFCQLMVFFLMTFPVISFESEINSFCASSSEPLLQLVSLPWRHRIFLNFLIMLKSPISGIRAVLFVHGC